jgi:REP element-mobilizing transposase RayT
VYFITICTKGREEYFGKIVDKKLILNEIGKICEEEIHLTNTRDGVDIVERIIMPNHVHMLIHIDNNAPPNVGTTRALSEHNKNMDENDLEKYLDENDLEKYLDENDLEKYLDENNLEKYTDENNLKKYTDENDLEKYTNENDLEKYTDENDLKKYTDENDLEKYTDENDLEKYTDENDLKKYSDENDLEKYSDEARLVPTTTKHTIKIHIQNQSLGSLVGSFKSSVSRICHKK